MKQSQLMKSLCALLMGGSLAIALKAQELVPYRILVNDPQLVPTTYIDVVYFDVEGSMANQLKWHKGVPGVGSSAQAEFKPLDRMGIQGKVCVYWAGKKRQTMKLPFHIEGGAALSLSSKIKVQKIKVPIKSFKTRVDVVDTDGNWLGRADAIQMNYIEVMADKEFRTWGRAGLMFRRSSYSPHIDANLQLGAQTVAGIYAGVEVTRRAHVVTQLADKSTVSAEYFKTYVDLMAFPLATFSTPDRGKRVPIGFRFGATGKLPGMRNFMNYCFPKVEFGLWPLDGPYWSVGLGINLYKS